MKNLKLILICVAAAALSSCKSTLNMPMDHAKLADGFVNSSSYDFGQVLVWDTQTNRVQSIYKIKPTMVKAEVDKGPAYDEKESSVSRDTKVETSLAFGVPGSAEASAKAEFISTTKAKIQQFNPREYQDDLFVLNHRDLRKWREGLVGNYDDSNLRFVFISRVTDATSIEVGRDSSGESNVDVNLIESGRYKFKVKYDNKSKTHIKAANSAPLIVSPKVFKFVADGSSLRFYPDLNAKFNFQNVN